MASSRKKQDEKNLKILRELGTLPQNKYCFDCNQRGPTYVNVTIGSFVCTKCSGILRGLTPPHRVKSISMATFTIEEVELLRNRGNDYCRHVWLGLYEDTPPTYNNDEQAIRDFMVDKYERRRYYMDYKPSESNNTRTPITNNTLSSSTQQRAIQTNRINNSINNPPKNNNIQRLRPELSNKNGTTVDFIADFDKADIFSSSNNNIQEQKNGFANFDNNPVFANNITDDDFSIFDLKFTNNGPVLNQVPLFPKCNANRWSMPNTTSFNNVNNWNQNKSTAAPPPPPEDKYAALKDLDNALKSQTTIDWSSSGSNGSLYSSPTPTGSVYSSPSPQNSVFGSPSQGHFMSAFANHENGVNVSNPFSNGANLNWNTNNGNGINHQQPLFANPFQETIKSNGFSTNFKPAYPINPIPLNGTNTAWTPNPFKIGTTTNSTNPFL